LLRQALTHRSYNNEHPESGSADNERLEYLGDAVLELIAAEHLYHTYLTSDEGELTRLRASVVNTKSLARLASRLSLGDYLLLGKGAHKTGARSLQSILANTFEAVIGAIFLDNYKGRLQEVTQERFLSTPQYDIIGASGPGHRREYTAEVSFGDGVSGKGRGRTKRDAEQMAAREALAALGALDHPPAQDEVLEAVAAHEARRSPSS